MSLFDIFADLSGLTNEVREHRLVMTRIAEALERVAPPLPDLSKDSATASAPGRESGMNDGFPLPDGFHLAETGEEYQARIDKESALAMSLGVAPWSPAFQTAINEMRVDLLKPHPVYDNDGHVQGEETYSQEQAEQAVREAFALAQAQAEVLTYGSAPRNGPVGAALNAERQ